MTTDGRSPAIRPDRAARAWHDFLRASKVRWSRELYSELHRRFEVIGGLGGEHFADADDAEKRLREDPLYQVFGWLERNLQRIKYRGPRGIQFLAERQRDELEQALNDAAQAAEAAGLLQLCDDFEYPDYYRKVEFHQHPGGVWSDPLDGLIYEYGRQTTTPMHVDPYAVHELMAAAAPAGDFLRILDWGCATGASTFPFARLYPDAELFGIDVSAPCLRLAALRAAEREIPVRWSQQAMEHTDFPDDHFDLVHSTFLLHEMPKQALQQVVTEAYRILRPGGIFLNLDFHSPPGGLWGQFIHYGHARRNNEVFMRSFCETDFVGMQVTAGFVDVEMRSFDDGTGPVTQDEVPQSWRFPWQLFVACKPRLSNVGASLYTEIEQRRSAVAGCRRVAE